MSEIPEYLDVDMLHLRGWTRTMIEQLLGEPDDWEPVSHWANFSGKRLYSLSRVSSIEASSKFQETFVRSVRRRKLSEQQIILFLSEQQNRRDEISPNESTTGPLAEAASLIHLARKKGYRTPHKC